MTLPKLSFAQWDLLDRIVATNGGGLSAFSANASTVAALAKRGLIQGKSGQAHLMVHTAEGYAAWNALVAKAEASGVPCPDRENYGRGTCCGKLACFAEMEV